MDDRLSVLSSKLPKFDNENRRKTDKNQGVTPVIILGVCAMAKKSESRAMKEILSRLETNFKDIKVNIFPQDIIFQMPIEKWPLCHALIAFHSKGFPLEKALSYVKLINPFLINNLETQSILQDRRKVYEILKSQNIPIPRYSINLLDSNNLSESPTQVIIQGQIFPKPFVEKPISAEDHNVFIYYPPDPSGSGGGSQRLFRKVGGWCSVHSSESHVRKLGSYIYEDYIPTKNGMDVKVYTVGPDYAHAEARRSPATDGIVERDLDGKEKRYPVILTKEEREIARKICLAFEQNICGFDLLRGKDGISYVCDVNGFSFVKNSEKYYEECAEILGEMVLKGVGFNK